jgi:hypothetical protein
MPTELKQCPCGEIPKPLYIEGPDDAKQAEEL